MDEKTGKILCGSASLGALGLARIGGKGQNSSWRLSQLTGP